MSGGWSRHRFESSLFLASLVAMNICFSLKTSGSCCIKSRQPVFVLVLLVGLNEMVHLKKVLEGVSVTIALVLGISKIQWQVSMGKVRSSHLSVFLSTETGHSLSARMVVRCFRPWVPALDITRSRHLVGVGPGRAESLNWGLLQPGTFMPVSSGMPVSLRLILPGYLAHS